MTDPTGGTIANITTNMLKGLQQAFQKGGVSGLGAQIEALAVQLGVSTAAVARGIAVSEGAKSAIARSLAKFLTPHISSAVATGTITLSETAAVSAAAPAAAGGLAAWFGGLTVGAQVAVVVGTIALTVGGAWVAGTIAADNPIDASDRQANPFEPPERNGDSSSKYVGVGVYADGRLAIISVRTTAEVKAGIASCQFRHGGIDCDVKADVKPLTEEYATAADATAELCGKLKGQPSPPPLAAGYQAPYGDTMVTVDDWGSIDFEVCRAEAGG